MTSARFVRVEFVFPTRPIPKLFTVNVVVVALVRTDRPFVYHADAPAACRIVEVMAGILADRRLAPL